MKGTMKLVISGKVAHFDGLINVTYEDVSTIFVLLVPCLAVLHTHLQHPFIHFLNVFDVSVKSNTLITINSTLN